MGRRVVWFFGEKILPLVVVAQCKAALVRQRQVLGKVSHRAKHFAQQLLEPQGAPSGQFFEVGVFQAQQSGVYRLWRARCRAVLAVTDGGVEAGAGFFLDFFQHRKEPPQAVGRVHVAEVEHGQKLLFK